MIKEIVLKQKFEKEHLSELEYVEREKLEPAKKWINSDLVKVILGPRRAGKSVFAFMLLRNSQFMYLNFDDEALLRLNPVDTDELMKELHSVYGNVKTIFFDEIQNLPNWELFVNRLHRLGYNLIITGSNAKLLSKELSTILTGRHIPIEIMPFNFKEFLKAKKFKIDYESVSVPQKRGELLNLINDYLIYGGFPEIVVKGFDPKEYLSILFDSVLFKDVVKRYKVRHSGLISDLASYLINNFSNYYTLRKLQKTLSFKSISTVEKYIDHLKEAYLIAQLKRFSYKAKKRIKSSKKIYVIDNGYIYAKAIQYSPDKGRLIENLVFTELLKRGFKANANLFYYKTRNGREVDFITKKDLSIAKLIQVSYETANIDTLDREIKSLIEASDELKAKDLAILTWDEERIIEKKSKVIQLIPIWKWI